MKIKYFFASLFFAVCTFGFTACSDDYSPITLVSETEHAEQVNNNGIITLTPYTASETFLIQGGSGAYYIDNRNKDVVRCDYDGKTLTLVPQTLGEALIIISDHEGNSYTLNITVAYPTSSYQVDAVEAKVESLKGMTIGDKEQLVNDIISNGTSYQGCTFTFTYTDESGTQGNVTISDKSGKNTPGTFTKTKKFDENNGTEYAAISLTLTTGEQHLLMFMEYDDATRNSPVEQEAFAFKEDVTEQYKSAYTELEKAYLILKVYPLIKE